MTKEKNKEIKQIIAELEKIGRENLTRSEKSRLARYKNILNDPEGNLQKSKKISATLSKFNQSEEGAETNKKRSEKLKEYFEDMIENKPEKLTERSMLISANISGDKNPMKKPEQRERARKIMNDKWRIKKQNKKN